jgi:hypothetical protein
MPSSPPILKTVFTAAPGTLYRPRTIFHGACIDTGTQKTVIGIHQAIAYCHMIGIPFNPRRSPLSFRFGSDFQRSLGTIPIRIPTANGAFLSVQVDVVNIDIPFLLGLEFLKKESLYADTVDDILVCKSGKRQVPLAHKFGHIYYDWSETPILYSKSELIRLHKHFFHPLALKMIDLICQAKPEEADETTRKTLKEISRLCKTCQYLNHKTHRFRVSMPKECIYNEELALDLMWIDGHAVYTLLTREHILVPRFIFVRSP